MLKSNMVINHYSISMSRQHGKKLWIIVKVIIDVVCFSSFCSLKCLFAIDSWGTLAMPKNKEQYEFMKSKIPLVDLKKGTGMSY